MKSRISTPIVVVAGTLAVLSCRAGLSADETKPPPRAKQAASVVPKPTLAEVAWSSSSRPPPNNG